MHWFGSLISGSRAVILKGVSPEWILRAVSEERATIVWLLVPWAQDILSALERANQDLFAANLTIHRLGEALYQPRLPEQGVCMMHDERLPASDYLRDSLQQLSRIERKERYAHDVP